MIAQPDPTRDFLTDDPLRETLRPIGEDYLAVIVLTADMLNAERRAAMCARHDAYVTALAETLADAVEASVWRVRDAKPGGRL